MLTQSNIKQLITRADNLTVSATEEQPAAEFNRVDEPELVLDALPINQATGKRQNLTFNHLANYWLALKLLPQTTCLIALILLPPNFLLTCGYT